MPNVKLTLAYDGTDYLGWQATDAGFSIEETLQKILEKILRHKVLLQAASRTDAGVHARGQIVNFVINRENVCLGLLRAGLNGLLPKDISIIALEWAADSFHATMDCIKKEYHYHLCYGAIQLPTRRFYSWHHPHQLDVSAMRTAAQQLIGQHDFAAFCNTRNHHGYPHHIRHVHNIEIDELPDKQLLLRITGNSFLYKMVRNLVGTLAYVGSGKIKAQQVASILASQDRAQAGVTAPAWGLSLHKVYY